MTNLVRYASILGLLVACSKGGTSSAPSTGSAAGATTVATPTPAPVAAAPKVKDDAAKQLLAAGTKCELRQGVLPLDCPEYKAMSDYAFQHQGSDEVAETCAAFLRDADIKKQLLAADCLEHLNSRGVTPQLGAALDAIEAEKRPEVRDAIAWSIKDAEAVSAKLDDRVLVLVTKLAADPKSETAASHVFDTLFPQYLMASGPKPPAKAQALALDALGRDGTAMQRSAFNAIKLIDDKPAVCKVLDAQLKPDAKSWASAAEAIADLKDACVAQVQPTVDLLLARLAAGDAHLDVLKKLDRVFDLEPAVRTKIATGIKAARAKAPEWQRKELDETAALFSKPAVKKT